MNFADQAIKKTQEKGPLVVGLDPHFQFLPPYLWEKWVEKEGKTWEALSHCVLEFNSLILQALTSVAGFAKIQVAFYEALGVPGMIALKETIDEARRKDFIVILDGKRNDVASTATFYAQGYLSQLEIGKRLTLPSFWNVDAITVSPYLGEDSLQPFFEEAKKEDKGVFVLARTTNPSAPFIQDVGEEKVFVRVARLVEKWGEEVMGESGFSSLGIVIGATYPEDMRFLREEFPSLLFLVPGIGAQGGDFSSLRFAFRKDGEGALITISRDIIFYYQKEKNDKGWGFEEKAKERAIFYQERLREILK
ncbi:MAG TPA: orotidine-5'-phosphate decarboxylase [Candidatus Atribacteria bacterium]|nr:orotidine-5'-phosphate decarboxylase [Candidatus Atribacteria bacterium]